VAPFEDISILAINYVQTQPIEGSGALQVPIELSPVPPPDWAELFCQNWMVHDYETKVEVALAGDVIFARCFPEDFDDLSERHLPEIKKVIAETNREYSNPSRQGLG